MLFIINAIICQGVNSMCKYDPCSLVRPGRERVLVCCWRNLFSLSIIVLEVELTKRQQVKTNRVIQPLTYKITQPNNSKQRSVF